MASATDEWVVDFPTLGFLTADWVEAHCIVPDGFRKGDPFVMYRWQLWCTVNHYRVKPDAKVGQLAPAFRYRRSQAVAPQKTGKGPWSAAIIGVEAVGPALFAGWAKGGEAYDCADHGCKCGWGYEYEPGEPMGRPWPTPLIQLLATSEDQVGNVYRPLQAMARGGELGRQMKVGEQFIRLPNDGRIDVVTSSAQSRLGNPITFALQDETGLYTKQNKMISVAETQRRGLAGMGGRSIETTNAWDPAEDSTAQRTAESQRPDIFRFHRIPPTKLSYTNKRDRLRIHRYVYEGSDHVDLDAIEAEAAELLEKDPEQAERFFGNRLVKGAGAAYDPERWKALADPGAEIVKGSLIVIGVDGARFDDALAVIATDVEDGHQWPLGIWEVPAGADDAYEHPDDEVDGVMQDAFEQFDVWRVYVDPQRIENLLDRWQGRWGQDRVVPWYMNRPRQTAHAVRRHVTAVNAGDLTHNGDEVFARHVGNATRQTVNVYDDDRRQMFVISKDRPHSPQKMDAAAAAVLSWEARGDAIAAGATASEPNYVYTA